MLVWGICISKREKTFIFQLSVATVPEHGVLCWLCVGHRCTMVSTVQKVLWAECLCPQIHILEPNLQCHGIRRGLDHVAKTSWDSCPYLKDIRALYSTFLCLRTLLRSFLWTRKWALTSHLICQQPDLGPPSFQNYEKYTLTLFTNHSVYDILLLQPKQTKTHSE